MVNRSKPRILVIGDVMLDVYRYGKLRAEDGSEPAWTETGRRELLGGAGSAAAMAAACGADVTLIGVVAPDRYRTIKGLMADLGIGSGLIEDCTSATTTVKERILAGSPPADVTPLLRIDHERGPLFSDGPEMLARSIQWNSKADAVILSDYGKGLLSSGTAGQLIGLLRRLQPEIPILVDAAPGRTPEDYTGADCLILNRRNAARLAGRLIVTIRDAVDWLHFAHKLPRMIVSLDADGLVWYEFPGHYGHLPAITDHATDTVGAGDMLIASLACGLARGLPFVHALTAANADAGLLVSLGRATLLSEGLQRQEA